MQHTLWSVFTGKVDSTTTYTNKWCLYVVYFWFYTRQLSADISLYAACFAWTVSVPVYSEKEEADFLSVTLAFLHVIYWWGCNCLFCSQGRVMHLFCIILLCVVMCVWKSTQCSYVGVSACMGLCEWLGRHGYSINSMCVRRIIMKMMCVCVYTF